MKIALFSDTYPPQINGVATATHTLAIVLRAKGNDVMVVTTALSNHHRVSDVDGVVRIPGFTIKRLYNYKFSSVYNTKVYRIIKKFDPDIIHVQTEVGVGIFGRIVARNLHIPLVYTYHTMYEDYTYYVTHGKKPFDFFAKQLVASLSVMIGDSTMGFTTTSAKTKDALRRYGVKKYVNIVPNGIDLSAFNKDKINDERLKSIRSKYLLDGKFVVLILGRLAKEKSNDIVIKYFHNFINKHPEYENKINLLIVGDGPAKTELMNLTKELELDDIVKFTGPVPHEEIPYYYHLGDVYCSASTTETQGLTYDEAMASRIVVLAKYDYNLIDVIKEGKTGFFFKTQRTFDEKFLKILTISKKDKKALIDSAYENDMNLFGLDKYYERMMNVYKKAVRKYW